MPTPEEVLAEFTRMQQEKNRPSAEVPSPVNVENAFTVSDLPDSVRTESEATGTPGIQETESELPSANLGQSATSVMGQGSTAGSNDTDLELVEVPDDHKKSLGPDNPLEVEPPSSRERLPHAQSTGTRPLVNKLNVENRFATIPDNFMNSVRVILKDAGADSMSQEKALARINELIIYPKPEIDFIDNPGIPEHEVLGSGKSKTNVISSDVPGNPNPE